MRNRMEPKSTASKASETRISVRVTPDKLLAIDRMAERENKRRAEGDRPITRSDMIRILLDRAISKKRKA